MQVSRILSKKCVMDSIHKVMRQYHHLKLPFKTEKNLLIILDFIFLLFFGGCLFWGLFWFCFAVDSVYS